MFAVCGTGEHWAYDRHQITLSYEVAADTRVLKYVHRCDGGKCALGAYSADEPRRSQWCSIQFLDPLLFARST